MDGAYGNATWPCYKPHRVLTLGLLLTSTAAAALLDAGAEGVDVQQELMAVGAALQSARKSGCAGFGM